MQFFPILATITTGRRQELLRDISEMLSFTSGQL